MSHDEDEPDEAVCSAFAHEVERSAAWLAVRSVAMSGVPFLVSGLTAVVQLSWALSIADQRASAGSPWAVIALWYALGVIVAIVLLGVGLVTSQIGRLTHRHADRGDLLSALPLPHRPRRLRLALRLATIPLSFLDSEYLRSQHWHTAAAWVISIVLLCAPEVAAVACRPSEKTVSALRHLMGGASGP